MPYIVTATGDSRTRAAQNLRKLAIDRDPVPGSIRWDQDAADFGTFRCACLVELTEQEAAARKVAPRLADRAMDALEAWSPLVPA